VLPRNPRDDIMMLRVLGCLADSCVAHPLGSSSSFANVAQAPRRVTVFEGWAPAPARPQLSSNARPQRPHCLKFNLGDSFLWWVSYKLLTSPNWPNIKTGVWSKRVQACACLLALSDPTSNKQTRKHTYKHLTPRCTLAPHARVLFHIQH
jgi:hypothetical protein